MQASQPPAGSGAGLRGGSDGHSFLLKSSPGALPGDPSPGGPVGEEGGGRQEGPGELVLTLEASSEPFHWQVVVTSAEGPGRLDPKATSIRKSHRSGGGQLAVALSGLGGTRAFLVSWPSRMDFQHISASISVAWPC